MAYKIQILGPAKRSVRNLQKFERTIVQELINPLRSDPRPFGCDHVMGYTSLLRVKRQHIRVIYSVSDEIKHVFIVDVRRRNEATYKNIPTQTLNEALTHAIAILKTKPPVY